MADEAGANRDGHGNQSWWRAPGAWLKGAASTTTAIGVVTYAVLRVDYALFYDRFGLKPEDVGLGQAELISQSIAGVVLILTVIFFELLLFAVVARLWVALGRAMAKEFRDVRSSYGIVSAILASSVLLWVVLGQVIGGTTAGPWALLVVTPVALWCLWGIRDAPALSNVTAARVFGGFAVVVFALSLAVRQSFWWTAVGVVVLFGVAVVNEQISRRRSPRTDPTSGVRTQAGTPAAPAPAASVRPTTEASDVQPVAPTASRPPRPPSDDRFGLNPAGIRLLVAAVVVTIALTETLLAFSAVSDAKYVRSGHAVQPTFLGVPLVSWGARAVEVAWDGPPPAGLGTLVDHCFLYLGQGDGVVLLYDHDTGRTVRISSSAVVLSIEPVANYERVCPR